jgi:catechol 2,3-dioxygenase-like lactoylglutathione lyase family enzyme
MSIHHLQLWVPDLGRAERSWGWLLGELGYELERSWDHGRLWRQDPTAIVIEASPDMVPGMLYSRLRPGLNHVAFHVSGVEELNGLLQSGPAHGWRPLGADPKHPISRRSSVAYLEDADGFEVELIAPEDGTA